MTKRWRALAALGLVPLLMLLPAAAQPVGAPDAPRRAEPTGRVLAISVDALNPQALTRLGRDALPNLWRLVDEGAATLNARSQYELTITLPNHTSMLTGRRVNAAKGGHGVTWNTDRPGTTVQKAAGHGVSSVYSVVHAAGGGTAFFGTKAKFSLFERSWDAGIDRIVLDEEQDLRAVKKTRADLLAHQRAFTFLHVGGVDKAGHAHGFMSPAYLDAVRRIDALLGKLLAAIDNHEELADLVIVLTADHGGIGPSHSQVTELGDMRVPLVVWGPGVEHGDLYEMNPSYENPGQSRPDLAGRQPVRNGDVANLVTDLLGLGPVPGSLFNAKQRLDVTTE